MRPRRVVVAALAVAVAAAVSTAVGVDRSNDAERQARRKAVDRYDRALVDPLTRGGMVIQEGMKPTVRRLGANESVPAAIQAVAWVSELEKVRAQVKGLAAPDRLRPVAAELDAALGLYIDAAHLIGAAGIASGEPRTKLLDQAVEKARQADERYDAAADRMHAVREDLGLAKSAIFV